MKRSLLSALLLLVAGLQTTFAQKVQREAMVVEYGDNQVFKHIISQVNRVTFGFVDEYVYVDLALPSGTLWASCNIGANSPEEAGYYFAWGETVPKATYGWGNYKHCKGSYTTLTKYCYYSNYGYNGYTDSKIELEDIDDAATSNPEWGFEWQTPSTDQFNELFSGLTTKKWTKQNDVYGMLITSNKNGNSIFLPAAGLMSNGSQPSSVGSGGAYWSRSLSVVQSEHSSNTHCGELLIFGSDESIYPGVPYARCTGVSIRPVRKK